MQFVLNNWYLFLALVIILSMLFGDTLAQIIHSIREVNSSQAVQLMNHDGAVVVDVCEPKEFQAGHIPGSVNIPVTSLGDRLLELEKHKSKPVIVSCRSGQRAKKGALVLRKHGFETVYRLAGGTVSWQRDNLPVEK